jgi:hypothetical protein
MPIIRIPETDAQQSRQLSRYWNIRISDGVIKQKLPDCSELSLSLFLLPQTDAA